MMNKLRTRIILLLVAGIIFSVLSVSLITNITLNNEFNAYMENEQRNQTQEIIQLIQENYAQEKGWTKEVVTRIDRSILLNDFDVVIRNHQGQVIYQRKSTSGMWQMHRNMMGNMMGPGRGMMSNQDWEEYNSESHDLIINNEKIGLVELGYMGPFIISEREIAFSKGINTSILLGAVIAIILAIMMGIYFSKYISNPIIKITEAAHDIRQGKLDDEIHVNNNIHELNELSSSINHLSSSLREQQKLRKRLTSDVAHELRTPLTILQSHIEAIIDGVFEASRDRMLIFKQEIDRLIKLVEELKHLTDIDNHQMSLDIETFNLTELLENTAENFRYEFQSQNIIFKKKIEQDVIINGDKDKLSQVLTNLLSNAAKFTNSEGEVTLGLSKNKAYILLEVQDTGVGISKEDLPYIFERLYRSDTSRNRETGGTGIGLTIAKKIIETHDGEIDVKSELSKGTKFTIKLPNH